METANLKIVTNQQATQSQELPTTAAVSHWPVIREAPKPVPVRLGRHLDVDEVLARSLPKVLGETVTLRQKQDLQGIQE